MNNVIGNVPEPFRSVFADVLAERDPDLLTALQSQADPTDDQREAVDDIMSSEIMRELGLGHEPSDRGKLIERAIEEFWYRWPND